MNKAIFNMTSASDSQTVSWPNLQHNGSGVSVTTSTEDPFNGTTEGIMLDNKTHTDFIIGLFLAVSSTIFIGSSFILKKKGLLRLTHRAGSGGFGYLREPLWWIGLILMGVGETANFAAYAFAPATLVTPLGALSVLVSAVLASHLLKERLNLLGKIGCFICIMGSTVVVLHSPKEQDVSTMEELAIKLKDPFFITYAILIVIGALVLIFYFGPRYGQQNPLVYIAITGTIGSLSVMACKGLGVAIKETLNGNNQFNNWVTWVVIAGVVIFVSIQMNYLNKSLDIFNTAVVTPILYVIFTGFVILASAILFKEWSHLGPFDVVGNICGFLTVVAGIFLLQAFKDMRVSLNNLPKATKPDKDKSDEVTVNPGDVAITVRNDLDTHSMLERIEQHIVRGQEEEERVRKASHFSEDEEIVDSQNNEKGNGIVNQASVHRNGSISIA